MVLESCSQCVTPNVAVLGKPKNTDFAANFRTIGGLFPLFPLNAGHLVVPQFECSIDDGVDVVLRQHR